MLIASGFPTVTILPESAYFTKGFNLLKLILREKKMQRTYTLKEEIWNSATHGAGIVFGIAALTVLTALSARFGNVWNVVSSAIFGVSAIILYSASTLYHAVPAEKAKKILKKFDHIAIYYLIAGTYTPFLLVTLRGTTGWIIFGIIWGLALAGTVLKLVTSGSGTKIWSVGLYLLMGWLIIFVSKTLFAELSEAACIFLIAGGLFYTFGVAFYVWKSKQYTHAVWHFMVLSGTVMHFFAILYGCVLI